MAERTSPVLRKRRLGRRVRQLREQAGMSLAEAAPRLDKTRSSLHRIEKGETTADVHLVRSMMDLYDVYDDTLAQLARDAKKQGWWRVYGINDKGYIGMETEAGHVLTFGQLHLLLECGQLPTVTLRVIPQGTRPHQGMDGAFTILRFSDQDDPDLLYVEYPAGALHVEKPEEVRDTRLVFDRLRFEALPPADSAALIERIAGEC